jgi:hypothetical protein
MKKILLFLLIVLTTSLCAKEYTLSGCKLNLKDVKESSYLSSGILETTVEIKLNNATLRLKDGMPVEFDAKKNVLKKAFLNGDHKLDFNGNVVVLKGETEVLLDLTYSDKTPTLISGHLAEDVKIKMGDNEIKAKALKDKVERDIVVSPKGYILSVFLAENLGTRVGENDFTFAAGSRIEFDKEIFGKNFYISAGSVKNPATIKIGNYTVNIENTLEGNIGFYESSEINHVKLAEDISLDTKTQTVPFMKSKVLYFYKDGIVKNGYVGKDITLKAKGVDKLFKKNSPIYFDKTGEVER